MSARESELRAADTAARSAAQSVFDRPLLLEAGAGTGKTHTLVARTLVWCLGPGWERHMQRAGAAGVPDSDALAAAVLGGVTALTFTEAAAREMSERVARALAVLARGELPAGLDGAGLPEAQTRRARAQALLAELERLEVRTIHAWCRRILAGHALAAGLAPDFSVDADGRAGAALLRELLEEQLAGEYPAALAALARRGLTPSDVEQALLELLAAGVPAQAFADDPAAPERLAEFAARGCAALQEWRAVTGECLAGVKGARTQALCAALAELGERLESALPANERAAQALAALAEWLGGEEPENWQRLAEWGRGRLGRGEHHALGARVQDFAGASAALSRWVAYLLPRSGSGRALLAAEELRESRAALEPLLRELERRLRARGVQSFAALLRDTHELLVSSPGLCAQLRAGMDQLLVDEFQDTDALQCDILRALALGGAPHERPGLFLVGDPKQSIYGWREADLAAYERFSEELLAAGGRREVLSVCFRAPAPILDEVERLIAPVMQARPGLQPPFRPLLPAPGRAAGGPAVEHWVTWLPAADGGLRPAQAAAACRGEAAAIAADLLAQHAGGAAWADMALLFRSRSDLDVYLEALRSAGVPYTVEGHRAYYRRREVIELAAWLRVIADPADGLALLAWLRAPCAGVPDAALLPLWERGFPERVAELGGAEPGSALEALGELIDAAARAVPAVPGLQRVADWPHALRAALGELAELRRSLERDPADRFVERLRTATCLEALEGARALGRYRLANAQRFFGELGAELCAGADVHALLASLRRRIRDQEEEEEGRPPESGLDAVSVRTIHQAKGLDFEHVYLVQTHKEARRGLGAGALAARRAGRWEYRLFGAATPGFGELEAERAALEQAERIRTLYVALTRARSRLVTVGVWPEVAPAQPTQAGSHVKLMTARCGGVPELATRAAQQPLEPRWRDAHGVLWVFLGAQPPPHAAQLHALGAEAALAPAEQIRRESTELARARAAAQQRASRPRVCGMSASPRARAPRAAPQPAAAEPGLRLAGALRAALGTAVHRALESLDLQAPEPLAAQLLRECAAALARLQRALPALGRPRVRARAAELAERVARGELLVRLEALREHVIARELVVWLPSPSAAHGSPEQGSTAAQPISHFAGVIDLVYRDPCSGELVIADYKTDRVASELAVHARQYHGQTRRYREALRRALQLDTDPRCELWFLASDRLLVL